MSFTNQHVNVSIVSRFVLWRSLICNNKKEHAAVPPYIHPFMLTSEGLGGPANLGYSEQPRLFTPWFTMEKR